MLTIVVAFMLNFYLGSSIKMCTSQPISSRAQFLKTFSSIATVGTLAISLGFPISNIAAEGDSINSFPVSYEGTKKPIKEWLGSKATLIVNVASMCALTPQYDELVDLYERYSKQGFQILAFPCDQFGGQEPEPAATVRKNMMERFGVNFPILDKIEVNGMGEDPLYSKLKSFKDIGVSNVNRISWNFEKFLVDSNGVPVRRYKPGVLPFQIEGDLSSLIKSGSIPERKKATLNDY